MSLASDNESALKYPSSSHYTRNWDKMVADIKAEEKDEKLEGDAALNKLFQQIYSDGSEEVQRAMNKSFVSRISALHLFSITIGIESHCNKLAFNRYDDKLVWLIAFILFAVGIWRHCFEHKLEGNW